MQYCKYSCSSIYQQILFCIDLFSLLLFCCCLCTFFLCSLGNLMEPPRLNFESRLTALGDDLSAVGSSSGESMYNFFLLPNFSRIRGMCVICVTQDGKQDFQNFYYLLTGYFIGEERTRRHGLLENTNIPDILRVVTNSLGNIVIIRRYGLQCPYYFFLFVILYVGTYFRLL